MDGLTFIFNGTAIFLIAYGLIALYWEVRKDERRKQKLCGKNVQSNNRED